MSKVFSEQIIKWKARKEQDAKILIGNPDFKMAIKDIRKKWRIPEHGFNNNIEAEEWEHWISEMTESYYDNELPKYQNELLQLRQISYSKYLIRDKEIKSQIPINNFYFDIAKLILRFKLSPRWKDWLKHYLHWNNLDMLPIGVRIEESKDGLTGLPVLKLLIDEDTSKEDLVAIIKDINFHQNRLPYKKRKKHQPIPTLALQQRIMELHQKGNTAKEIVDLLGKEDIFLIDTDIYRLIKNYKKKLVIN